MALSPKKLALWGYPETRFFGYPRNPVFCQPGFLMSVGAIAQKLCYNSWLSNLILLPMVSSKLLELENAVNNLSMEEKIWLLEKIVVQMRELTKVANWQVELNREQGNLNANSEEDPLIGLFAGSPDLATNSEEILREEIKDKSGWSYKEMSL